MSIDQFAIVELMGHRRFGARVSEVERFGVKMLRAEILTAGEPVVQDVHPQSVYAITTCTEDQARKINTAWSLQNALPMLPSSDAIEVRNASEDTRTCHDCGEVVPASEIELNVNGEPSCDVCRIWRNDNSGAA